MTHSRLLPCLPQVPKDRPPLPEDLLRGTKAIAEFMGLTADVIYRMAEKARERGGIPIFHDGVHFVARRSSLVAWYDALEAEAMKPKQPHESTNSAETTGKRRK